MRLFSFYFLVILFILFECEFILLIMFFIFILNIFLILLCDEEVLDELFFSKCFFFLCVVVFVGVVVSVGFLGGVFGGVDGVLIIFFIFVFDGEF